MSLTEKIDDYIIRVADQVVTAWNWTTGRTKTDLANTLNVLSTGAHGMAGAAITLQGAPLYGAFYGGAYIILNLYRCKRNAKMEKMELEASHKEALNLEVENNKQIALETGKTELIVGTGVTSIGISHSIFYPGQEQLTDVFMEGMGAGFVINGCSSCVMCSNNNPPKRKDVVRRGLEVIAKKYESIHSPVPQPSAA